MVRDKRSGTVGPTITRSHFPNSGDSDAIVARRNVDRPFFRRSWNVAPANLRTPSSPTYTGAYKLQLLWSFPLRCRWIGRDALFSRTWQPSFRNQSLRYAVNAAAHGRAFRLFDRRRTGSGEIESVRRLSRYRCPVRAKTVIIYRQGSDEERENIENRPGTTTVGRSGQRFHFLRATSRKFFDVRFPD